jgi:hypothetical protein
MPKKITFNKITIIITKDAILTLYQQEQQETWKQYSWQP